MSLKFPLTVFGRRLKLARLKAGLPQDRLGVSIGLDELSASARMSRYEAGIHEPPFDIAVRLGKALGLPTAYFYCEDDDLADIILLWGQASPLGRERIKVFFSTEIPGC